ncbi:hypothetical protein LOTGIDRAFT_114214 [Lottia gigantea]|uniref:Uncharacterized protein n=1 Tax=Lottia gigantea TaxID=225164 RepID=V4AVF0_LOTGI|nr:hypothetical protein LOTGIDRAFT_114214 [Lottia gigantea]ESO98985.1 hypothetical protein LOTGIDRAFT_114214 [Lottia gigantea]
MHVYQGHLAASYCTIPIFCQTSVVPEVPKRFRNLFIIHLIYNNSFCYSCIWEESHSTPVPRCIYPEQHGYIVTGEVTETWNAELEVELERINTPKIYAGEIFNRLLLTVQYQTDHRVRIKIQPKDVPRYEVPQEALDISDDFRTTEDRLYDVSIIKGPPRFAVVVKRRSDSTVVFSTDVPGLTFTDQFLQITTRLPSSNLYGFGEHNHRRFQHDMNWKTWSIFAGGGLPIEPINVYGVQPTYMNLENDGKATMVLLKNSNAMDVVLQPDPYPAVTYRVIGGILDFYIFMGPTPEEAVQQYIQAIGKPMMPPYWAQGYHLCRWGYLNITDVHNVMSRNRESGIPYEGQWVDIEYMYKLYDYTYDKKGWVDLPKLIEDLHNHHQKFIVIIVKKAKINSPGYDMYDDGVRQDIFIKNSSNKVLIGKSWPGISAFPDFTNPKTENWWYKWMSYLYHDENIKFDALWIDLNEPKNFVNGSIDGCIKNRWNNPPYIPNIVGSQYGSLNFKTICMDSQQHWGRHYDVHSLYGHSEAIQTYNALLKLHPQKRPWAITRSNFVGTGKYASKWMGDNQSKWSNLHWSIASIMEFSMFGFSLNGVDICGFQGDAEYEMCIRWHQLGAFYPFARNHNGRKRQILYRHQDPAAWDQRFIDIVKPVLMTRYRLLPYLYTLMFKAHQYGDMVMKALLFEFPTDKQTWSLDKQFLLGPALLISPVLQQNQTKVEAYFPQSRWYDYMTGEEIVPAAQFHNLYTPLHKFNLHVRGGYIIPVQRPDTTTYTSRKNSMDLLIALDEHNVANGELFLDDGEGLSEVVTQSFSVLIFQQTVSLRLKPRVHNYEEAKNLKISTIEIYGLNKLPQKVTINGRELDDNYIRQSGQV